MTLVIGFEVVDQVLIAAACDIALFIPLGKCGLTA
jgi:hypothetical protein